AVGLDAAPEAAVVLRREAEQRVLVRGEDDRRVRRPFREDLRTACDPDVGVGRGKHERVTRFDRQSRPLTLLRNALARCGIDRVYVLSDIEAVLEDVESAETPERDRADSDRTRRADERRVVVAVTVQIGRASCRERVELSAAAASKKAEAPTGVCRCVYT